jgi:hypothetical protein
VQLKTIEAAVDETRLVTNKWTAEIEKRGTTVSSSSWETTAGSVSGAALSGSTATVTLAVTGRGTLTNTVVLANGETLIAERDIRV